MDSARTCFPLHPLSRFESGRTSIKRPRELTYFSYDGKKQLHPQSTASLRYYYPPFIPAPGTSTPEVTLSNGFNDWVKADDSVDGHLDALLDTIQTHEEALLHDGTTSVLNVRKHADIVTWRGMMTKVMTAAFDIFNEFEMNATCYQEGHDVSYADSLHRATHLINNSYIEENHSHKFAEENADRQRRSHHANQPTPEMMQYWGYKFESLSVLPKPWSECTRSQIETRDREVVDNNEQYCSIVSTSIGTTSLVLGGEVDCILGEKPASTEAPIPWIELKTSAEPPNDTPRERQKFERKLLKFWAQSFLLGVPSIIVGFRTSDGHLTRIQEFETQRLPGVVSRGQGSWNGNVCINMTAAFLDFLKATLTGTEGLWRIKREKNNKQIEVFKIEERGTGQLVPDRFKAHRERLLAREIAQKLNGKAEPPSDHLMDR